MTENLHYVDLWKKQSELFWRTVYSVPFIGIAVFAGWFGLESGKDGELGQYLLIAGILIMLVQMAILYRMSQYLNAFREAADTLIPSVPSAFWGLSGYRIGVAAPVILVVFFSVMLFVDIKPSEEAKKPSIEQRAPNKSSKMDAQKPRAVS
jgi:hypothetical protein